VTATGCDTGGFTMCQTLSGGPAQASHSSTVGTLTVSTGASGSNKLPAGTYDVNFLGGAAYTGSPLAWTLDCMSGQANPPLGLDNLTHSASVSSLGVYGPATFNVPTGESANQTSPLQESAVCISDSSGNNGNEAPIQLM
jgi:hypothetical protein